MSAVQGANETNLRERVLHEVRLRVMSGEIGPGTMLSVPGLARSLGISTTPIREALLQLSSDGILQPRRNRGFTVVDPTLDELRDLLEVRVQLEGSAFAKLARTGTADLAELSARADEMAEAVGTGDVMLYLAADRAFHARLLALAGNDVLTEIVMRLRDRMRLYGIRSAKGLARQRASIPEHYDIIEALRGRSTRDPSTLMRDHIMEWEPVLTEAIESKR